MIFTIYSAVPHKVRAGLPSLISLAIEKKKEKARWKNANKHKETERNISRFIYNKEKDTNTKTNLIQSQ